MYDTNPSSSIWEGLLSLHTSKADLEYLLSVGAKMIETNISKARDNLRNIGFGAEFEGYKVAAINMPFCGSSVFESIKGKGYDLLMPFYFDGRDFVVSIYRGDSNINCAELAAKYGGGGHPGAAGFVIPTFPFTGYEKIV